MSLKCQALEALPYAVAATTVLNWYGDRARSDIQLPASQVSTRDSLHLLSFAHKHRPDLLAEAAKHYPHINEAVNKLVEVNHAAN